MSEDEELLRAEIARLRTQLDGLQRCVGIAEENIKYGWQTARESQKAYEIERKKRLAAEQERDAALAKLGRIALNPALTAAKEFIAAYYLWAQRSTEYGDHPTEENAQAVTEASLLMQKVEERITALE